MNYHYRGMWVSSSSGSAKQQDYTKPWSFQEYAQLIVTDTSNSDGYPVPAAAEVWFDTRV